MSKQHPNTEVTRNAEDALTALPTGVEANNTNEVKKIKTASQAKRIYIPKKSLDDLQNGNIKPEKYKILNAKVRSLVQHQERISYCLFRNRNRLAGNIINHGLDERILVKKNNYFEDKICVLKGWKSVGIIREIGWTEVEVSFVDLSKVSEDQLVTEDICCDFILRDEFSDTYPVTETKKVPLSFLYCTNLHSCMTFPYSLTYLKASIKRIGLLDPITVNRNMEILNGMKRLQAVKELGWEKVPVRVVELNKHEENQIIYAEANKWHSQYLF